MTVVRSSPVVGRDDHGGAGLVTRRAVSTPRELTSSTGGGWCPTTACAVTRPPLNIAKVTVWSSSASTILRASIAATAQPLTSSPTRTRTGFSDGPSRTIALPPAASTSVPNSARSGGAGGGGGGAGAATRGAAGGGGGRRPGE